MDFYGNAVYNSTDKIVFIKDFILAERYGAEDMEAKSPHHYGIIFRGIGGKRKRDMKILLTLDDNNGLMFNRRRQSRDIVVREKITELTAGVKLWMNNYSQGQFQDVERDICVDEDFLCKAEEGEYCFVENVGICGAADRVEEMILFKWNRKYPCDFRLDFLPWDHGFTCVETEEFQGNSHDKITMEVWRREK